FPAFLWRNTRRPICVANTSPPSHAPRRARSVACRKFRSSPIGGILRSRRSRSARHTRFRKGKKPQPDSATLRTLSLLQLGPTLSYLEFRLKPTNGAGFALMHLRSILFL